MTRKRVENREESLGNPEFVKPVFTKGSKPLGKRKEAPKEVFVRSRGIKVSDSWFEPLVDVVCKLRAPSRCRNRPLTRTRSIANSPRAALEWT
ncbi:hypothetical protein TNCV_1769071 [Trichonephila clavipes]|nr:hypothetical protein TNCV_1769071 [Trichonephila clavipes]